MSFARDLVYRFSLQQGFSTRGAFDLKIIAGEALSNIIKHAYEGRTNKPIFLEFLTYPAYIEIRFRDVGRQTPVTARDSQDLGDYRERGLGVYLISQLADYHYYDQARPAGTELVVKKRIG